MNFLTRHLDDLLLLSGCLCILYGLSLWNVVATWIVGGAMSIAFGFLVGASRAQRGSIEEELTDVAE